MLKELKVLLKERQIVSSSLLESTNARVVELVDTQDLKSCDHCDRAGSTPAPGTKALQTLQGFCILKYVICCICISKSNKELYLCWTYFRPANKVKPT